jgi:hypothetical protein
VDYLKDLEKEYLIRSIIANHLGVHINEVIFVGSAKLGFSLNPTNLFNKFDSKYEISRINKDKSDLDIAIVSYDLFEYISKGIFNYTDSFRFNWKENEFYFGDKLTRFSVPINYKYFEYYSKGWFRPDFKPRGYEFCPKESYETLKRKIFYEFKRKMSLGIYKDWFYFKNYHINNLNTLSMRVQSEII